MICKGPALGRGRPIARRRGLRDDRNPEIERPLQYVRTDPDVIPKVALTGDTTHRTDTRVLQVIYSFDPASLPLCWPDDGRVHRSGSGGRNDIGTATSGRPLRQSRKRESQGANARSASTQQR